MVSGLLTLLLNPFQTLRGYGFRVSHELASDRPQRTLKGQRILVVEDNAHMAALVRQSLLGAGALEVMVVGDGDQGFAQLSGFRPDILVTDMVIPVAGGLELVRAVRKAALTADSGVPNPALPIVLVSAHASHQSVQAARAAGIDAFVLKPFSIGSLVKRVHRAGLRTAEFIVNPAYVGPDRRGKRRAAGSEAGARRLVVEPRSLIRPSLRLVRPGHPIPDNASPSLLKVLYARIQELEAERGAETV